MAAPSATPAAARTADRGTPRQSVSIAQPEVQSNTATWSVSPSARSSASEKERAPATRPRMSTRQTAKSTEGVGSPKNVVAGGTAPAGSQREPVNRRAPPRKRSTKEAPPHSAIDASPSAPPASSERRERRRSGSLRTPPTLGRRR